jgi:hypothetical protein
MRAPEETRRLAMAREAFAAVQTHLLLEPILVQNAGSEYGVARGLGAITGPDATAAVPAHGEAR